MAAALTDGTNTFSGGTTGLPATNTPVQTISSPTTPAVVPTTAPTLPTAPVSTDVSKSVSTVSSKTGTDFTTNTVAPAIQSANDAIAARKASEANGYVYNVPDGKGGYYSGPASGKPVVTPPVTPTPPTSNNLGTQTAYHPVTGDTSQIPVEDHPSIYGLSATNPKLGPTTNVSTTATIPGGTTYKSYTDGTYGKFDANGNYIGSSSAGDYQTAQAAQSATKAFNSIGQSGNIPLTSSQQAQIEAAKQANLQAIQTQVDINANVNGGMAILMNLRGLSGDTVGLSTIAQNAAAGAQRIVNLQATQMAALTKMQNDFENQDYTRLKDSYDAYMQQTDKLQANIDKLHAETVAEANRIQDNADKQRTYDLDVQKFNQTKDQNAFTDNRNANQDSFNNKVKLAQLGLEQGKAGAYIANMNAKTLGIQTSSAISQAMGGLSGVNSDGTPNIGNANKIYALVPLGVAETAKSVIAFKSPLSDIKDAKTREAVRAVVLAVNPNYDTKQYGNATKYLTDYVKNTPTSLGGSRTALGAMAGHIDDLNAALSVVDSGSSGFMNAAGNAAATSVGPFLGFGGKTREAIGQLNTLKQVFSEENLKYLKGASGGEEAAKQMQALFAGNLSHEEAIGAVKAFSMAITDKTTQLLNNQKDALGYIDPAHPIMNANTATRLYELNSSLGVDNSALIPVLNQTSAGQIYLFKSTPEGLKTYQDAQASATKILGRPANADELLQAYPNMTTATDATPIGNSIDSSATIPPESSDMSTIDTNSP